MKISFDWLQDFIDLTEKDGQKIKDIITERTAEVETMESQGDHLENVVVGKITEVKAHPNADSLRICMVSDGQEEVQIVCGGSNLREGQLIVLAKLGAVVKWHGTDVVKMEKAKIRGEESFGMICAAEEVGLEDMFPKQSEKEIVDLTALNLTVGMNLAEALGLDDVVLDVDNHAITNRSDLFSHRGFAREFVANGLGKWKKKKEVKVPTNNSPAPVDIKFEDKEVCSRYMGVYLTDVQVQDSPDWMKKRLAACGVNPISNMVDITNYVMLELGMPLHAFDVDRVSNKKWTMRTSKKGEKVVTLDKKEHELEDGYIVLDDGKSLIDLCGVMGGLTSSIENTTKNVWLIAPVYHPTLVRRGMRGLGHVTDAGIIYEKGVDPMLAEDGLNRAIELILELCPTAKIGSKVTDVWNVPQEKRELELSMDYLNRLVGIEIPEKEIERILTDLDFSFEAKSEERRAKSLKQKGSPLTAHRSPLGMESKSYRVIIPSHRLNDIHREADLVEEIARIYGFNNIPEILPVEPIKPVSVKPSRRWESQAKWTLTGFGFDEIYTFAFLGPELLKKTGMPVTDEMIEVTNPISSDMSLMRTSLLPRMLETIADNLRYQDQFSLFELSKVYHRKSETEHEEKSHLLMATVGQDFRTLQGVVESFGFKVMPVRGEKLMPFEHPGRVGSVVVRGKEIGHVFEIHPQILKRFDIKERVVVAELNVQMVHDMKLDAHSKYQEINRFPSVKLDVSLLIDKKTLAGDYMSLIEKTDKKLISQVELIDEYAGDKVATDKRALTFSITYQASDRTLTDKEVETIHQQVLDRVKKNGAEVR